MDVSQDLSAEALAAVLPDRPVRAYPAMLSTEADAQAWARQGAPAGAIVCAEYQASPRGRAGWEWTMTPGESLAFSMVVRPTMKIDREGWLYTAGIMAVADVVGAEATIEWPDEVYVADEHAGSVGVYAELGPNVILWGVVNVLITRTQGPRAPLLARVVESLERRIAETPATVLNEYLQRLRTIGRQVRARMIPLGPGGPEVKGIAVGSLMDGALLIERPDKRRVAVRPQNLGVLEDWTEDQDDAPSAD